MVAGLEQVEDALMGKCSEVCASVADIEAAEKQRIARAAAAEKALLEVRSLPRRAVCPVGQSWCIVRRVLHTVKD